MHNYWIDRWLRSLRPLNRNGSEALFRLLSYWESRTPQVVQQERTRNRPNPLNGRLSHGEMGSEIGAYVMQIFLLRAPDSTLTTRYPTISPASAIEPVFLGTRPVLL